VVELRFAPDTEDTGLDRLDGLAKSIEPLADRVLLYTDDADYLVAEINRREIHHEQRLTRRSTLEDVFLRLTGRRLVD
jgi:lipooligosaccharide transport system ATP-binding protein